MRNNVDTASMRYKMAAAYGTSRDRIQNMMPQDHEVRLREKTAAGSLGQGVAVINKGIFCLNSAICVLPLHIFVTRSG
jgi:hypothetical protein